MAENKAIIKLTPAFKDYLWGGIKLKEKFDKKTELNPVAESWELSTHPDGQSIVSGGEFDGLLFGEYLEKIGKDALGKNAQKFESFPILIKFIDAEKSLSIQVHPDDSYAMTAHGEYGKTEMWYIVDCDDDASLYYGVNRELSKADFENAIKEDKICDYLNEVKVAKGDVFFIPAGTIHAIGAGIVICEIQQNSNTTYRVYDFGRKGADGKLRELHIDRAIEVSKLTPSKAESARVQQTIAAGVRKSELAACNYFTSTSYDIERKYSLNADGDSFVSVVIIEGSGIIAAGGAGYNFVAGDSFFVPANTGAINIEGTCKVIESRV